MASILNNFKNRSLKNILLLCTDLKKIYTSADANAIYNNQLELQEK